MALPSYPLEAPSPFHQPSIETILLGSNLVVVGNIHPLVVGDHVAVNGQDCLRVRLDPRNLNSIFVCHFCSIDSSILLFTI